MVAAPIILIERDGNPDNQLREDMAKANAKKPSKSDALREAFNANPNKSPAEIAKELKVTSALVYNVKAGMKKKSKKAAVQKRRQKAASDGAAPHGVHAALDAAFEFVTKVGGLLHAEKLIAKLKSVKERW